MRAPETTEPVQETDAAPADILGLLVLTGLLVYLWLQGSGWHVVVVLALVAIIFLHELGHFLTAKAAGMKVTEFFLGFGPRLWSFRRGETEYGIKAIPAGAYVRIIGMSNLDEVDPADEPQTYRAKPYGRRLSVAVAGSAMHFLLAVGLIYIVNVAYGIDAVPTLEVDEPVGPAREAGIEAGDRIVALDGRPFDSFEEMTAYVRARPGDDVVVTVDRGREQLDIRATLADNNDRGEKVGFLGIAPGLAWDPVGPVEGVGAALSQTRTAMWEAVTGIGDLFSPDGVGNYIESVRDVGDDSGDGEVDESRPSSVVGIVQVGGQVAERGLRDLLYLLFFFNVFIGVFNLTPILPFDGGHVVIATYEKVRSVISGREHRADVRKLMPLTYVVVMLLALLFVTTVFMDIVDPISLNG